MPVCGGWRGGVRAMLMVVNDDDTDTATDLASNQADDSDGR